MRRGRKGCIVWRREFEKKRCSEARKRGKKGTGGIWEPENREVNVCGRRKEKLWYVGRGGEGRLGVIEWEEIVRLEGRGEVWNMSVVREDASNCVYTREDKC